MNTPQNTQTTGTRILVIDDDREVRELLEAFFKPKGYKVVASDAPAKALKDIEENRLECDVIISDMMATGLSGIEFTKRMKALGHEMPIILMGSKKSVETAMEAVEAGAYDFVMKPLHLLQLQIAVERALHLGKIKEENTVLRTAVKIKENPCANAIVGRSAAWSKVLDLVKRVASSNANVFISGESGCGKEVVARAIHNMGARSKAPFIAINCSSIPETLLESELFGHTKGAFTGAADKKIGLFEEAEGGTLFLDEIGDLSAPLQAKLLRVLQERQIKRIGENQFRKINVRVLSATHKDLRHEIAEKNFRDDLFFRLNVIEIKIPPLRDRKEDILPLAEFFLKRSVAMNGSQVRAFSKETIDLLLSNPWPGNVRELENAVERAVVLCRTDMINPEDLPEKESLFAFQHGEDRETAEIDAFYGLSQERLLTVDELVKRYIQFALSVNHGVKEKTAHDLNIDRKTLYRKIREINTAVSAVNPLGAGMNIMPPKTMTNASAPTLRH